jgi:anaerobic dimethyl sulfoxide reductase subunit A
LSGRQYSLQLITPHVPNRALTTYGNLPLLDEQMPHAAEIHPDDALPRGIADGDAIYVFNDHGCIRLAAALTHRLPPGVVAIGQGVAYRPSLEETCEAYFDADGDGMPELHTVPVDIGGCVNTITADINAGVLDPFLNGLGLAANGILCEISKAKPGSAAFSAAAKGAR